eukprot:XP_011448154.1 PREDICTED: laccase-11 [Crassostrea gigas]
MNSRKNFFIRAESMELKSKYLDPIYPGVVKAIFRYEDAPDSLPDTTRQKCTRENACKVINCPNKLYPEADHVNCFSVANLLSTQETINSCPVPVSQNGERIREDFLNFHFTAANPESQNPVMKATINGHVFTTPTCPPQSTYGPKASSCINDCNKQNCLKQQCSCTHLLNYDNTSLGSAVQLVLLSRDGLRGATDHPIHIHGHSFHVLKTVYPELDPTTGLVTNFSRDIECESETCLTPRWSNKEWAGGNLPDLNLQNPPLKDTVVVPRGGYVVLRFYLDNPGYWFLHCHMDAHQMEGMTLIIKEGQRIFHPKPPKRFPSCGDFTWSLDEYKEITDARIANLGNENNSTDNNDPQKLSNTDLLWDLTIAVLITCSFGAVLFLLCLFKYYLSNCLIERRDQDSPYSMLKQNNRAKPQSYGSS